MPVCVRALVYVKSSRLRQTRSGGGGGGGGRGTTAKEDITYAWRETWDYQGRYARREEAGDKYITEVDKEDGKEGREERKMKMRNGGER